MKQSGADKNIKKDDSATRQSRRRQKASKVKELEARDLLMRRIEEERRKIGPLTLSELTSELVIARTALLERLINDFTRLRF